MSKFLENAQYRVSNTFSKRLKLIMYYNDCSSNKQFADFVGVSVSVIAKAVNFGIIPSSRSLIKIADKLDVSLPYLLGAADDNQFVMADLRKAGDEDVLPSYVYECLDKGQNNTDYRLFNGTVRIF